MADASQASALPGMGYTVAPQSAEPPLALALDVGTSSARAFVFDGLGRAVSGAKLRYDWTTTPDGGVETTADALVELACGAVDEALGAADGRSAEIRAVGLSNFWHGVLGVDDDGRAATPVYPWHDRRAADAAAELRGRVDEDAVHGRTGAVFHPSYLPARLVWLSQARPEAFRRARFWMSFGEYLALRLTGARAVTYCMASATGLFNRHTLEWDAELLELLPTRVDQLSPLVERDEPLPSPLPKFADRWPALADIPWFPALGDGAAANMGSGCSGPDAMALSVGTSAAMRVLEREPSDPVPRDLWRYLLDREHALTGGAVANGGVVFGWLREFLRLPERHEIKKRLGTRDPGAHGLTVLPYLLGERSPDWPLDARGAIVGLTFGTTPLDLLEAALEGVACRIAAVYNSLSDYMGGVTRIVASGGGIVGAVEEPLGRAEPPGELAASSGGNSGAEAGVKRAEPVAFARIMVDMLGRPIELSPVREASARGAALLALEAAEELEGLGEMPIPPSSAVLEPDRERHERYAAVLERYRALDQRLRG